jgi:hypothetical protein
MRSARRADGEHGMAYDAAYDWAEPRRWRRLRRWTARFAALLALVACGAGVYEIVHEATRPGPAAAVSLQPQVRQVAASTEALAVRLEALRPGPGHTRSRERAVRALREARGDLRSAADALSRRSADGKVRDQTLVAAAFTAHRRYLSVIDTVLAKRGKARRRAAAQLPRRARRAMAAWAALPDPAGLPASIRGYKRVAALA